jgi:predicted transcriptional regulator
MDTPSFPQDDDRPEIGRETPEERQRRLAWEAEAIKAARASAAAGRLISLEAVEAWIESLDTDHELPPPRPGQ